MSFKPYYTWMTFNTITNDMFRMNELISFKPYYTWMTFNTAKGMDKMFQVLKEVLNLIIHG